MPSQQLNSVINQALIDSEFCTAFLSDLSAALVQADVPPEEIDKLVRADPKTLEELTQYIANQP